MKLVLSLFLKYLSVVNCIIVDPGPAVTATRGEIWPKPHNQKSTDFYSIIRPSLLKFTVQNQGCSIFDDAIVRYKHIIGRMLRHDQLAKYSSFSRNLNRQFPNNSYFIGYIDEIGINLRNACEDRPHPRMTEDYILNIGRSKATLKSDSIWGILRGLESFSQLLIATPDTTMLRVNSTKIIDKPRYSHRGLLVDTSRHYMTVFTMKQILDGMVYNKLNVFHWHIVDDHSFPYESKTFPELSKQGAYTQKMVYSQSQVQEIIEYARVRGIRTIAEFDAPGHTRSWGISYPELHTACEGVYKDKLGPLDPTKPETYDFMEKFLSEIVDVFPDEYVHVGGDEIDFECWASSIEVKKFMIFKNLETFEQLGDFYIQRIIDIVKKLSRKSIVWQEVFKNEERLANGTIVQVWLGDTSDLLNSITGSGYEAILSTCWYLDHLGGGRDWYKYYKCEPRHFFGNKKQQSLLIGGEACMWPEFVDNSNILQRIFPRVSAVAERLWSPVEVTDLIDAEERLEKHTCRMKKRGIPAQPPNGPGFCY